MFQWEKGDYSWNKKTNILIFYECYIFQSLSRYSADTQPILQLIKKQAHEICQQQNMLMNRNPFIELGISIPGDTCFGIFAVFE